ncbi:ribbon-helix-helix protein, CopG family [Chroococcidiopsis sp. CCMEE 29]|uniref:ribbon-helix-helix domain-containing protein n=1 Tax=Chroococcidiopsis sp. CCMEE 29 TaxID=155894 RepID=UPI002020C4F4|nr:ribbon-helix-helix protein, CopG family [Chroococcidiopsis sp. CCMEE 29]
MTVATDKSKVSVYMDADLKRKLEALAKEEGRSVSNLLERLAVQAVKDAEQEGRI